LSPLFLLISFTFLYWFSANKFAVTGANEFANTLVGANKLANTFIMEIIALFILGCFGGFLFGMVGIGGNVLYIPVFSYFLTQIGFHDEELSRAIIANALFILVFTGTAVSWQQFKVGNFFLKEILLTAATGVTAAFLISFLIKSGNWYDKKTFDLVFTGLLFFTLLRLFTSKKKEGLKENKGELKNNFGNKPTSDIQNPTSNTPPLFSHFLGGKGAFFLVGAITGTLTAFSGLGGSIIMIPLFTEFVGLTMKKAHSISVGVVPLLALTISTFYFFGKPPLVSLPLTQFGYLNFGMAAPVILGSMLTSPFGVKAAHTVKPRTQKMVFATIVGVVLFKMMFNLIF
jgi:uncharacterized protein